MAAVRACGDGALLSGMAAADLLGLVKGSEWTPDVTARLGRRVPGVITRESRRLHLADRFEWLGIPVTSAARTLVDIAEALGAERLGRACHEAGVLHGTTPRDVDAALARRPNAKGAGALRALLHGETRITLSELERRFLLLLQEADLPLPRTNHAVGGRRVDARWPDTRLTVELDSYRFHSSRHAWEKDRRREREAYERGDAFRRYTWDDVTADPRRLLDELRGLLLGR
jgi:very-short-patch-repair endonuclease